MENSFNIVSNTLDTLSCIFLGSCIVQEYEYIFILNDEKIKADDCFSNYFGRSYCVLNDVKYNNVAYESKLINEYKTDVNPINIIFLCFILMIFVINSFIKIIRF